jgi:predicted nucleic acid-binding protein
MTCQRLCSSPVQVAPAILLPEVAAAVARGADDPALARRVLEQLVSAGLVELVAVTVALVEQAARIAADQRIRGCDAVYVALADQLADCLVSLDRQQLERAAGRVAVLAP